MTADPFQALVDSILKFTQVRGDAEANRDALIAEAADFTPEQQADLAEHFNEQADIWAAATRSSLAGALCNPRHFLYPPQKENSNVVK